MHIQSMVIILIDSDFIATESGSWSEYGCGARSKRK